MSVRPHASLPALLGATALLLADVAGAAQLNVIVTVRNLAPANSVSFAPLQLGFHNGTSDAFTNGQVATAPIISVAEGGAGTAWRQAFSAAEPNATVGVVGGLLQPGESRSTSFRVDSAANPFFTFATMVVPSNDFFIGNDSPTRYRLFDNAGNLLITSIAQTAGQIWDAGSETFDPAAAAFVGNNDLRTPQGGVVGFDFSELSGFNGLLTGAGYTFQSALLADTGIYQIEFATTPIPIPAPIGLLAAGLVAMGAVARRRARTTVAR
ncbi:MAG: spondin domain-containing protein [bacterium]